MDQNKWGCSWSWQTEMTLSLTKTQGIIWQLGDKIFTHKADMMMPSAPVGDGTPHLEIKGDEYHYVSSERGFEFSRGVTTDLDELLYWFFEDKISSMGFKYEVQHRVENQDFRRVAFAKKIELLSSINPLWGERAKAKIAEILKKSPYNDFL